jgi:GT2 family glycosyltransferase
VLGDQRRLVRKASGAGLYKMSREIAYNIDSAVLENGVLTVRGWALGSSPIAFSLKKAGKEIPASVTLERRRDVCSVYPELSEDAKAGFTLTAEPGDGKDVELLLKAGEQQSRVNVLKAQTGKAQNPVSKTINWLRTYGIGLTAKRVMAELFQKPYNDGTAVTVTYSAWRNKYGTKPEELEEQRKASFSYAPKFSLVVPLYNTNPDFLKEMIASVQSQTYANWELCLADGSPKDAAGQTALTGIVSEYEKQDPRIRYAVLEENLGISENTNAAIKLATGEFLVLVDHDDLVPANALYECVNVLNDSKIREKGQVDVIYSDEDKVSMDGKQFFDPHFKSDYNVDLLCSMNYICHLFVVRRTVADRAGWLRKEFDGAQDHDFIFRCCEAAEQIYHIPKILYHWRCHMNSTAANPESKLYAFEAGRRAVEAHYHRMGIPAKVEHGQFYGLYKTVYEWEEEPLISIVIPNKDHIEDLRKCMASIEEKSAYRNFEFVIVENNSTEQETFDFYDTIKQKENVQVLYYEDEFNFSRINNFGVSHANGEYLLLLNNDTEIINQDCLKEMLGVCMRPDVGIVGARLFYPDDTIQHAGVVLGFGGLAGHTFIGCSRYDNGYFSRIICTQDYSAVTAACLMISKADYERVGGMSEDLAVAFNDIDFCMKVREAGLLVVYNPAAELYHYESKSRGIENTAEKVERFNSEIETFSARWRKQLLAGDPYYNVNLSLNRSDFGLRE